MGHGFNTLTPHAHAPASSLKGGNFFEFRSFGLKALVQREGNHAPTVLRTAFDTALVAFADAVQPAGVRNGQRTEHHGVDKRENGSGAADAQCQGQYRSRGENRRQTELPEGVTKI